MCLQPTSLRPWQRWHWAGDEIVHPSIIPASRTIPGTRRSRYPIDVREYLSIEGDAVIAAQLEGLRSELTAGEKDLFTSRRAGSFDFRAHKAVESVGRLKYIRGGRRFDQWLFPAETLARGGGDCEDLAFVLAAFLEACGISEFCLRVAFGTIVDRTIPARPRRWDHAWVVYQNEAGVWEILEPLALIAGRAAGTWESDAAALQATGPLTPRRHRAEARGARMLTMRARAAGAAQLRDIEYVPHFVFNRKHLWRIRSQETAATRPFDRYLRDDRIFWTGFNPSFAASVHNGIFDEALAGMGAVDLAVVKAASLALDVDVLRYDPRDHFDFAYVDQGWARVRRRLRSGRLVDFALATHAIGDFYAHTLYADFAPLLPDGNLAPFDADHPLPAGQLVYDFSPFAPLPGCACDAAGAERYWQGRLVSGQWRRWYVHFPGELESAPGFRWRLCLPDHDQVAVDGPCRKPAHLHYTKPGEYDRQFLLRRQAAVSHIRRVWLEWNGSGRGRG